MTEDELKAIEERTSLRAVGPSGERSGCLADMQMQDCDECDAQISEMHADIAALVAEVRRLREAWDAAWDELEDLAVHETGCRVRSEAAFAAPDHCSCKLEPLVRLAQNTSPPFGGEAPTARE